MKIGDTPVQRVEKTEFLGVWLDEKLNWDHQIKHLLTKTANGQYALRSTRDLLDTKSKMLIHYACIHSHLCYSIASWGPLAKKSNMKILQQKNKKDRCKKLIGTLTKPIASVEQLLKTELGKISYKYVNSLLSARITNLFEHLNHSYPTWNRNSPTVASHNKIKASYVVLQVIGYPNHLKLKVNKMPNYSQKHVRKSW